MQPAFIYAHFGANMANFLVEQAELDRTDTIKGFYSLHDVTMDDDQPVSISFDDTDITHVKAVLQPPTITTIQNKERENGHANCWC